MENVYFSENKGGEFQKKAKATIHLCECENEVSIFKNLSEHKHFVEGSDLEYASGQRLRIKHLEKDNKSLFAEITLYECKAKVPVTPVTPDDSNTNTNDSNTNTDEPNDLADIENYDRCQVFMYVIEDKIFSIFQITPHPRIPRFVKIFKCFGIEAKVTDSLNKSTMDKIKKEGVRSINLAIQTDRESIEEQAAGGFIKKSVQAVSKIFDKEGSDGNDGTFYGTLVIEGKNNVKLANDIQTHPERIVNELSDGFFLITGKGNTIKSSEISTQRDYYTIKYGSTNIKKEHAKLILEHFIDYVI
ncbi:hypothetical protein [Providencia hangzhouensis]|uniref:hypothetical protein n=1 Tax=Providencia hangzhouensis TaxID=3031799 RepID=UPI0034DCEB2C